MLAGLAARKCEKHYLLQLFFEQVTNLRLDVSVETSAKIKRMAYVDHNKIVSRASFSVTINPDAGAH